MDNFIVEVMFEFIGGNSSNPKSVVKIVASCKEPLVVSKAQCECFDCGQLFDSRKELRNHKKTHLEHWFECAECRRCFDTKAELNEHKYVHYRSYPCRVCNVVFNTGRELLAHKSEKHTPVPHECKECGRIFQSLKGVNSHMRVHRKPIKEPQPKRARVK